MVNAKYVIIGLIAAACAVFVYLRYFQGDEAMIRKQFDTLAESAGKSEGDSQIAVMQRVNTIKSLFADTFELNTPFRSELKTYGKQDLNTFALAVFSKYAQMSVEFHDLTISVHENGSADAILTAKLSGRTPRGEQAADFHELECQLEKTDDGWLFTGIEFVDVLEK